MSKIRLKNNEVFELYNYVQNNKESLNGLTKKKAIEIVSQSTGIHTSDANIRKIYNHFNLQFSFTKGKGKNQEYKKEINRLKCMIKTITLSITELYEDMGSTPHPNIKKIYETLLEEINNEKAN